MGDTIAIGDRLIGPGYPAYVIAEAGVNHNGDLAAAVELVHAARRSGADAVKFQAFDPSEVVRRDSAKAAYQQESTGDGSQLDMLEGLSLGPADFAALAKEAQQVEITFLCTPFDLGSLSMLEDIGVKALKTSSTDLTNFPFLRAIARSGLPAFISTGASTLDEVLRVRRFMSDHGAGDRVAFLHCCSEYPAPPDEANLAAIATMQRALQCVIGYSDHTAGVGLAPFAVAMGACIVEKHLTLDRNAEGPDHRASLDPAQFQEMVDQIRLVERARGDGVKSVAPCETANRTVIRRSLVARSLIQSGDVFTEANVALKRPAIGLAPEFLDGILGKRATRTLQPDDLIALSDVDTRD